MGSNNDTPQAGQASEYTSLTRPPATRFITENVPAPSQLYVSDDASLQVRVSNTQPGVTLIVTFRMLVAGTGTPIRGTFNINPGTTGATQITSIPLTEGFLLSVVISLQNGFATRGSCFAAVTLSDNSGAQGTLLTQLFADYITQDNPIGYPFSPTASKAMLPGWVQTNQFTQPAAGAEFTVAVTPPRRWRLQSIRLPFVTSAVAGNRIPKLTIGPGAQLWFSSAIVGSIPASQTTELVFAAGIGQPSANNNVFLNPLPVNTIAVTPDSISTLTAGIQAGDQYGIPILNYEELLNG